MYAARVIKHRHRAYVQAAEVLGYGHARIMFRHILPNVTHIILIAFSVRFPASVATEVFISFRYRCAGRTVVGHHDQQRVCGSGRACGEMTFVTLAIFALVLAFNHVADELRDLLDRLADEVV